MNRSCVHRLACVAFVIVTATLYAVAALPAGQRGKGYILAHALLAIAMLAAWWSADTMAPAWVLGAGVAARLLLVAVAPFTTSDVARYLWDGHLVRLGLDPYVVAPLEPIVSGLRPEWLPGGVHNELPTLYPPGAIALFAVAALAGPARGVLVWKIVTMAASLAMLWAMDRLLRSRGCRRHLALVALSPLIVLEGGVGAHVDVAASAALALALWRADAGRPFAAGRWLGVGLLLKLVPALAILPMAARAQGRRGLLGGMLIVVGGGYGGALCLGFSPIGSIEAARDWRFGSPIWLALEACGAGGYAVRATVGLAGVFLVSAFIAARTGRSDLGVQLAVAAPMVASPVVYPWYLLPLASLGALAPSATSLAWSLTLPLTYEVIDRADTVGAWEPRVWPLVVVAAAVGVGVIIDLSRARCRRAWAQEIRPTATPRRRTSAGCEPEGR